MFEIVTLLVTGAGIAIAFTRPFRIGSAFDSIGRNGGMWMHHEQDLPIAERPSADTPDPRLPKRPLRGRAD